MSSKIIVFTVALLLAVAFFLRTEDDKEVITIGIIQTASHPALDQTRDGFMAELSRLSDSKVRFVVQNAEGSLTQAQSIAENFHVHQKIQAVVAIGTPAVQAICRVEKEKPIFIAAVSEPESLDLAQNVCGTTDRVDTEAQADLVIKMVPECKKVAILYNPAEANSQAMRAKMVISLQKRGIEAISVGVNSEAEVKAAALSACKKAEAILIPADNLMAQSIQVIARQAQKMQRPLIASDVTLVSQGATAALGADYRDLGRETAKLAVLALFQNKMPCSIGIHDPKQSSIVEVGS